MNEQVQDIILKKLVAIESKQDLQLEYIHKVDKKGETRELKIKLLGIAVMGTFYFVLDVVKKKLGL